VDFEDWLFDANESYYHHYGLEFNDEQIEWMQIIYEEYADDHGEIDWDNHTHDSAWYYYLTEVMGYDEDVIDRYTED